MDEQLFLNGVGEPIRIDPVTGKQDEFIADDDFSYSGYQVTREEFFAHAREPSLTICGNKMYLNKACLRKAPDTIRVLIMISESEKKIIIKPSSEERKDSVPWVTERGNMRRIRCKDALCARLSEITGWNLNHRYKMIGKLIRNNGERLFLFNMDSPLIYPRNAVYDEKGQVVQAKYEKSPVYPESWKYQFGLPVEEHERRYAINRFDNFVTVSVQDEPKKNISRPTLEREEQ